MRRILVTTTVAGALALAPVAQPAGVAAPAGSTATRCTAESIGVLNPGLGLKEAPGSFQIEPGTATCNGQVQGLRVSGPGTYSSAGRTFGAASCVTGGKGWGVAVLNIPTRKGVRTVTSPLTFSFSPISEDGLLTGRYEGDYISGTFTVTPIKGDCVTSAVTKAKATFDFTVHGFRGPR